MISPINLLIAFAAGAVTFFAGCMLPLVPSYVSFLTGVQAGDIRRQSVRYRVRALGLSLIFIAGFLVAFVFLGVTFSTLARYFAPYKQVIRIAGGLLMALFGVSMTGLIPIPAFYKTYGPNVSGIPTGGGAGSAFLLGLLFAFTWTPCVGPVLASILFWSSQTATFLEGTLLLVVFALGLGVPFLIVGVMVDAAFGRLSGIARLAPAIERISGVFLIITGLLFATGSMTMISGSFINWMVTLSAGMRLR